MAVTRIVPEYVPGTVFVCPAVREPLKITNSFTEPVGEGRVSTEDVPLQLEKALTIAAPTGTLTEYVIFNGSLTGTQTNTVPGTYSGTIRVTATPN